MRNYTIKLYGKQIMTIAASSRVDVYRRLRWLLKQNEDMATMSLDDFEIE